MGVGRRRTTRLLVAAQVAAAVLLVTGAGLLARSLDFLGRVDPGFEIQDRVTARLDLPSGLEDDTEGRAHYLERMQEALEADGRLVEVGLASTIPFGPESETMATFIPGVTEDPNNLPVVHHRRVSPGFLEVLGVPLLAGRGFTAED